MVGLVVEYTTINSRSDESTVAKYKCVYNIPLPVKNVCNKLFYCLLLLWVFDTDQNYWVYSGTRTYDL